MLLSRSIVLIGLMGAGKTQTGQALSRRFSAPFYDTDDLIIAKEGMSVADIFAQKGEPYFRQAEKDTVRAMDWFVPSIIATGGGLFVAPDNQEYLKEHAYVIWLDVPLDVLEKRLVHETASKPLAARPLLSDLNWKDKLAALAQTRRAAYAQAHWTCAVSVETAEDVADRIVRHMNEAFSHA